MPPEFHSLRLNLTWRCHHHERIWGVFFCCWTFLKDIAFKWWFKSIQIGEGIKSEVLIHLEVKKPGQHLSVLVFKQDLCGDRDTWLQSWLKYLISKEIILLFSIFLWISLVVTWLMYLSPNFGVCFANELNQNIDSAALWNQAPAFYSSYMSYPKESPCCSSSKEDRGISFYSMECLFSILNSDSINSYPGLQQAATWLERVRLAFRKLSRLRII